MDSESDSDSDSDSDPHNGPTEDAYSTERGVALLIYFAEVAASMVARRRASVSAVLNEASVEKDDESCCAICLDQLGAAVSLPCDHVYHRDCIFQWLQRNNSCPLCRYDLIGRLIG